MTTHRASCTCGQLAVTCAGDPVRVSVCHCLACQQRTGSAFGVQARFPRAQVTFLGSGTEFVRTGDSGGRASFRFCPTCGTTVFWVIDGLPEFVTVAVGAFADPGFMAPTVSVYEERRHAWALAPDLDIEHID